MQKLEGILVAEDTARHAVSAARDEAATLIVQAEAEARALVAEAAKDASSKADDIRSRALGSACEAAAAIESDASTALAHELDAARTKMDSAVKAVMAGLAG